MKKLYILGLFFLLACSDDSITTNFEFSSSSSLDEASSSLAEVSSSSEEAPAVSSAEESVNSSAESVVPEGGIVLSDCDMLLRELGAPEVEYSVTFQSPYCRVYVPSFNNDKMVRYLDGITGCAANRKYCEGTFTYTTDGQFYVEFFYKLEDEKAFYLGAKGLHCRALPKDLKIPETNIWFSQNNACNLNKTASTMDLEAMFVLKDSLLSVGWDFDMTVCERSYTCFDFRKIHNSYDFCLSYDYNMDEKILRGVKLKLCDVQTSQLSSSSASDENNGNINLSSSNCVIEVIDGIPQLICGNSGDISPVSSSASNFSSSSSVEVSSSAATNCSITIINGTPQLVCDDLGGGN